MTDKKIDWDSFEQLRQDMEEGAKLYEPQCDTYWDSLNTDDKLMAFYSVVKRIHKGEMIDKGTYRWVLYDVFGFGFESYAIGMECGFMDLHNAINVD